MYQPAAGNRERACVNSSDKNSSELSAQQQLAGCHMHLAYDAGSAAFCGLIRKGLLDAPPQAPAPML